ncbi:Trypsin-like peptidase domain-containing protein [Myxococcus fulvus]|uniref:Trypsin-like peptidase domain-containing protein n=1 Tax=Myxococcus fulvus TaxID=33 RepID=A0ABY1C7N2_MYXFU|nr:serine protease [Myxococcus fulvus]SET76997.1 Trypsin-like peptidase domain-containing protein [Myxococcus fulvus]
MGNNNSTMTTKALNSITTTLLISLTIPASTPSSPPATTVTFHAKAIDGASAHFISLKIGDEDGARGSGFVIGIEGHDLIIATAAHVILGDEKIMPQIFPSGDVAAPVPGEACTLLASGHPTIDVAFLRCPGPEEHVATIATRTFARTSSITALNAGSALNLIGRGKWRNLLSDSNNALLSKGQPGSAFRFSSEAATRGFSGGPILDKNWNIVGLTTGLDPTNDGIGLGVRIEDVLSLAIARKVPVNLSKAILTHINEFTASPSEVRLGAKSQLQWRASGATICSLNGKSVKPSDSLIARPTQSTSYLLVCSNESSRDEASVTIEVVAKDDPPFIELEASASTIRKGERATLRWSSTNSTQCRFNDEESTRSTSGTRQVSPSASGKYTLQCRGPGGESAKDIDLIVLCPVKISSFRATPNPSNGEETVNLSWESSCATSCAISPDIGDVESTDTIEVEPRRTTTYRIECSSDTATDRAQVRVRIQKSEIDTPPLRIVNYCCTMQGRFGPGQIPGPLGGQCLWIFPNGYRLIGILCE